MRALISVASMNLRRKLACGVVLALSLSGRAQEPAAESDQGPSFKVDVKLVNVYATVNDKNGAPVADLTKDDFAVTEDGRPEKIAIFEQQSDRPLSIVLGIDTSASVRKDHRLELDSARRFVASTMRGNDSLALYQFAEEVHEVVPFT